jgi:hypothetical protein
VHPLEHVACGSEVSRQVELDRVIGTWLGRELPSDSNGFLKNGQRVAGLADVDRQRS